MTGHVVLTLSGRARLAGTDGIASTVSRAPDTSSGPWPDMSSGPDSGHP